MKTRDPILVEVLSSIGDVQIEEEYLYHARAPKRDFCHGQYGDGVVTINPAPSVVQYLVHELLHHVRPEWSERSVVAKTTRLIRQMSHEDVIAVYEEYLSRRKVKA